jgi:hypothetical protein
MISSPKNHGDKNTFLADKAEVLTRVATLSVTGRSMDRYPAPYESCV